MADFKCEVTQVLDVCEHTNSDNLELIKVFGYQVVATKNIYKKDDIVVFIPPQSILPVDIQEKLGVVGFLAGPNKDRLKSIKLRGEISEGILLKQKDVDFDLELGQDVKGELGIKKYIPEIPQTMKGQVKPVKAYKVTNFDFNSIKKDNDFFGNGEHVVITEKLHGTYTNIICLIDFDDQQGFIKDGVFQIGVTSKGMGAKGLCIDMNADQNSANLYCDIARNIKPELIQLINFVVRDHKEKFSVIEIMGETYGKVQKGFSYDGFGSNLFRAFDMKVHYPDGKYKYINSENAFALFDMFGIQTVPVLYKGPYHKSVAMNHAHGNSELADHIKEGCVIRPKHERLSFDGRRVIAKLISNQYSLRKGGTEYQ